MNIKEKLYFLLEKINDISMISPSDGHLIIDPDIDLNNKYRDVELNQLFLKLEKDENVIKIIKPGDRLRKAGSKYGLNEPEDGCWHIKLRSAFNDYYHKIQQEPQYQEFIGKKPQIDQKDKVQISPSEIIYEITYSEGREILINGQFILGKPDFERENDLVFDYLINNPNKIITKEEIEKAIGSSLTKSLHKIVENLGFRGEIKKVFIDVSKVSIRFRNPITRSTLDNLGINKIKLN